MMARRLTVVAADERLLVVGLIALRYLANASDDSLLE